LNPPDDPVFAAPWQAQAFAMTLALHERGAFTWPEWTQALAEEIAAHGGDDRGEHYYEHWLAALERLATAKGLVTAPELGRRMREWQEAARRTPHGMPIQL
jgi:nitrile hydratase accessory protein